MKKDECAGQPWDRCKTTFFCTSDHPCVCCLASVGLRTGVSEGNWQSGRGAAAAPPCQRKRPVGRWSCEQHE